MQRDIIIQNKKERIQYIDALRGFTMILVVFAHVEAFGFFNFGYESFIGKLFQSFRMPLFFFISGFIAYKADRIWDGSTCWKLTKKKMLVQIIPALFFGLIYVYLYLHQNFSTFIADPSKSGYWFTFVLLEMFLVYYFVSGLSHSLSKNHKISEPFVTTFALVLIALALYLLKLPLKIYPLLDTIGNYSSLHYTFNYFMYFVFGVLARQYFDVFARFLDNKYFTAIVVLLFACIFYVYSVILSDPDDGGIVLKIVSTAIESVTGFLGIIIVYSFFRKHETLFDSTSKIGRSFQYIGRRTLDIYLLHYFFLPHLPKVGEFLISSNNVVMELLLGFGLSILIVGLCLCVSNVIRISPFLGKYLLGARN